MTRFLEKLQRKAFWLQMAKGLNARFRRTFSYDPKLSEKLNFEEKIHSLEQILHSWNNWEDKHR